MYSGFGVPLVLKGGNAIMESMDQTKEALAEMRMRVIEGESHESVAPITVELPRALKEIWGGDFELVADPEKLEIPLVCINFVMSREGIFNLKDAPGGGAISQGNRADAFGMAILRAQADAVMVGSGTVNGEPNHVWNTDFIFDHFSQMNGLDDLRREFSDFRESQQKKEKNPPTFFMTNSGDIDFSAAVFQPDSGVETYVVTGERGRKRIIDTNPAYKNVLAFGDESLDEQAMLEHLRTQMGINFLLHEGGRGVVEALVKKGLVTQFQLTQMGYSPKGNTAEGNVQYLFGTADHNPPADARIVSSRRDATGNATIKTFDFRNVRTM